MATLEHELLRFFARKGESTLRQAVDEFGAEKSLTRGTIVKMTDRLHKKGLLKRRVENHVFVYSTSEPIEDIEAGYVGKFVQSRLRGSVAPLLAFLSGNRALSKEEREAIKKIAERIEDK